ncbi:MULTISPECIES: DUF998 domain-containing protein [unclassified Colwellia]|uniref:DUF998 domain-containing protein n=1 Tax=unclassified Colwellia TaxID=196834 RepID=UPI0015F6576C|nr:MULTISPECIES: DUF998 domain-containing protein [unclassified Colwellia]MBA6233102.1 DUF998 domain-containing protein [Colwellia sp. MB02u-7]MBA6236780.1 DUF998 domain-containing protein [Colwellia sp. MB02u-11]MBA6255972.1 DUF998 domain-containing protein [Colwellia sp. MB3u-28]MBA6259141.1 DUF998 domain-containing protein [Colwellia sp. MB3u-41]MBA6299189.1 DUF998 domain-containing protein [Colwellia sp. MB3u-22]
MAHSYFTAVWRETINKRWLVIAVIISYLMMLFGGAALKPDYSHISQFISELNATGTPYAGIVSWLGFFLFGVLASLLLFVTADKAPVRGISRIGYWLLIAEPIAYMGSAFSPCDFGCPVDGGMSQLMHNALAVATFISTSLGLFLLSFTPKISVLQRVFWVVLSCLWQVLFVLMLDEAMLEIRGLLQRIGECVVYSVLCISAWRLLSANKDLS